MPVIRSHLWLSIAFLRDYHCSARNFYFIPFNCMMWYDYALTKNERALIAVTYLFITYKWRHFFDIDLEFWYMLWKNSNKWCCVIKHTMCHIKRTHFRQKKRYCLNHYPKVLVSFGKYIRALQSININAKSNKVSFSRLGEQWPLLSTKKTFSKVHFVTF